jgi:hypothetical protein
MGQANPACSGNVEFPQKVVSFSFIMTVAFTSVEGMMNSRIQQSPYPNCHEADFYPDIRIIDGSVPLPFRVRRH